MKVQIIIEQARAGSFQYRIRRASGEDWVSPQNYGSQSSAFDFAIERINKERKLKSKKAAMLAKKRGGFK